MSSDVICLTWLVVGPRSEPKAALHSNRVASVLPVKGMILSNVFTFFYSLEEEEKIN
jgi:hypothetical protein